MRPTDDNGEGLDRFVTAQDPVWPDVLAELRDGCKQSHWMWFVFPQLQGLGRSPMARHYALASVAEARAYLAHPVLGPRLETCCQLLLDHDGTDAVRIFGPIDARKLRSCLTLFRLADPDRPVFTACLARYFGGEPDPATLALPGANA